jgi:ATP-dependent DNA helicase RecG
MQFSAAEGETRERRAKAAGAPGIPEDLAALRGVGPALKERLARLGVHRPLDLLFLLPQRYEDRTHLSPIGSLLPGRRALIEGDIALTEVAFRRRRSLLCRVSDGTGQVTLRFFHFSRAQQAGLARGARVRCYGEARMGPGGLELVHPEYRVLAGDRIEPLDHQLTPVYPTTENLQQFRIRNLVSQALDRVLPTLHDYLPQGALAELKLPDLRTSLLVAHRPAPGNDVVQLMAGVHPAQRRLAFEEMLAHHLSLRRLREQTRRESASALPVAAELRSRFLDSLGFELTRGQRDALAEIETDLAASHPMMRLLQGDVGCGKTVVAALAALHAIGAGQQAAVLAPTELLADQHQRTFGRWFERLGIRVVALSGSLGKRQREAAHEAIANGEAQFVVGTHALFQDGVEYHRLGLIVVDEQHRFGVHQRLALMQKAAVNGLNPHQLVMTATPIPRTLAMTMYADLDVSVIHELPPGRLPVQTIALPDRRRPELVARVREAARAGRRAYWVCPLIDDSEVLDYQAAESTHAALTEALAGIDVGLVHGRMRQDEKDAAMAAFANGKTQVLVATTVIEVGVDVPAATLMIIENAERMGLAQLHQLRGRVGRGSDDSTCVLLYHGTLTGLARQRLEVLRDTTDGFKVAEKDLQLRGPGEVLGTRQTGAMQFRVADLMRDADLAPDVQRIAKELGAQSSGAVDGLIRRWIGEATQYGQV